MHWIFPNFICFLPLERHYPIEEIIDALDGHMTAALKPRDNDANTHHRSVKGSSSSRRRAMIEYVMCKFRFCAGIEQHLIAFTHLSIFDTF
jgi:hypothetical protein